MSNENTISRRRNPKATSGFVKFPTDTIQNSGEGGVFVRLVVIDTKAEKEFMNRWIPCCGGYQSFFMDECFLGDDLTDRSYPGDDAPDEEWGRRMKRLAECTARYFPNLKHETEDSEKIDETFRYISDQFLCVMTLGATGWSSSKWVCTFDDLTDDGKTLVDSLRKLYDGCEIRLLTFLDT